MSYKRLTNNNLEEYNPELDFCAGCKYYGEPNGCNRPNGTCGNYERFIETYNRLAELEDKIENGTLIELPCKVGDTVYYTSPEYYNSLLVEYVVTEISQTREGLRLAVYGSPKEKGLITYLYEDYIGKTVFLTKAEAEKN